MAGRLNKEKATMHSSVLDITLTLRSQLLSQISRVLIFDVFHYRIPAIAV